MKELDRENARLKRLVAERDLEIDVLREINTKQWYAYLGGSRRDALPSVVEFPNVVPLRCVR